MPMIVALAFISWVILGKFYSWKICISILASKNGNNKNIMKQLWGLNKIINIVDT